MASETPGQGMGQDPGAFHDAFETIWKGDPATCGFEVVIPRHFEDADMQRRTAAEGSAYGLMPNAPGSGSRRALHGHIGEVLRQAPASKPRGNSIC